MGNHRFIAVENIILGGSATPLVLPTGELLDRLADRIKLDISALPPYSSASLQTGGAESAPD
jgi:hypothetical protein